MREDVQKQFLGSQARTVVTIPTVLPRITTSLPKIKKTKYKIKIYWLDSRL